MSRRTLRIATRASNLALWQANFVANLLRAGDSELTVELVHVTTTGDRVDAAALNRLGGVGVFTREIQQAVLDQRADIAVHSLKDLPTVPVSGIDLVAVPDRASPWDVLVLPGNSPAGGWNNLSAAARMGTGSLRRRAQLLHVRPDLRFLEIRGNVETRLRKLDEGQFDALVLAEAGLDRLGLADRISARLSPPILLPAVGQGALGVECRSGDELVQSLLEGINLKPMFAAVTAEREVLSQLGAGCHAPVGVSTTIDGERLDLEAVVLSADGQQRLYARGNGPTQEPAALGRKVASDLLRQGAGPLIKATEQRL